MSTELNVGQQDFGTVLIEPNALFREGLVRILADANFQIVCSADSFDESMFSILSRHQSLLLVINADSDPEVTTRKIRLFKEKHRNTRIAVMAGMCGLREVLTAFQAGANAYIKKVASCDVFIKSLELIMLGETIVPSEILPFILHQEDLVRRGGSADAQALAQVERNDLTRVAQVETNGHSRVAQVESNGPSGVAQVETNGHSRVAHVETNGPSRVAQVESSAPTPRLSAQEWRILQCLREGDSNKVIARKLLIAEATVKVHVKAILRKTRAQNRTQAAVWATCNGSAV